MAKIAAEHEPGSAAPERHRKVSGPAAQIEHAGIRSLQNRTQSRNRPCTPELIDVQRKNMVQQIVTGCDLSKHVAHPRSSLSFIANTARSSSTHASDARTAAVTASSGI